MARKTGFAGFVAGIMLLFVALLYPLLTFERIGSQAVQVEPGVFLAARAVLDKGMVELRGEVEVYPGHFLSFDGANRPDPVMEQFPHAWPYTEEASWGSYRFFLDGLEPGAEYGLFLGEALTAYEVYADGRLIARQGVPAAGPEDTKPGMTVQSAFFTAQKPRGVIVMLVSSHGSHLVGFWQKLLIGTGAQIHAYEVRARQADAFVVGAILLMTIYIWILRSIMGPDRILLSFAVAAAGITLKSLLAGQQLLFRLYPDLPYEVGFRLSYLMVPVITVALAVFAQTYFNKTGWRWFVRTIWMLSLIQALMLLVLPQRWYQQAFVGYQLLALGAALVVVGWAVHAFFHRQRGAGVYLLGFFLFLLTAVNDILYSQLLIRTGYYLGFGLFALMLSQASLLAFRMRQALETETYLKEHLEQQVLERTQELELEKERFKNLSQVDSLTGLYNKGAVLELLHFEMEGVQRYGHVLSVVMIDLDHFKQVNDTYGHVAGDAVLQQVAQSLSEHSRRADLLGRFGGEEFLLVLRFTGKEDAVRHADELRTQIADLPLALPDPAYPITASFGIATTSETLQEVVPLLEAADRALYEAKRQGRNRVVAV